MAVDEGAVDPFGWLEPLRFDQPDPFTPLFDSLWAVYVSSDDAHVPEPTRAVARIAPSVVDVLTQGGILRAAEVVELAANASLDLAAAATMLEKESYGGRNVWGSDGVNTAGTYIKGSEVTQAAYLAYRDAVAAGKAGRQGVGPCQLTWSGYQIQADGLGGCWDWRINCRVGFEALASGIRARGLRDGFRGYNGSGPAAERYAQDAMARYRIWQSRLAGTTTAPPAPEEDEDLTPEQNAMLVAVYQQLSGSPNVGEWPGWQSFPEGSGYSLTPVDYLRQTDVQLETLLKAVTSLQTEVASLRSKLP